MLERPKATTRLILHWERGKKPPSLITFRRPVGRESNYFFKRPYVAISECDALVPSYEQYNPKNHKTVNKSISRTLDIKTTRPSTYIKSLAESYRPTEEKQSKMAYFIAFVTHH